MEVKVTLILYSKYSSACTEFLPLLDNFPKEARDLFKLQPLCVDTAKVRNIVIESGIKSVPCVHISYTNKQVEKLEGNLAFNWAVDIINRFRLSPPPKTELERENSTEEKVHGSTPIKNLEIEQLKNKLENMEKSLEEAKYKLELQGDIVTTKETVRPDKKEGKTMVTSIDNLPDISDDGDSDELIGESHEVTVNHPQREHKKTFIDRKSETLKNSAAEMQKMREEMEEAYSKGRRALA